MNRRLALVGLAFLFALAGAVTLATPQAIAAPQDGKTDKKTKKQPPEKHHIVRVDGGDMRIVNSTELQRLRKKAVDDFKKAAQDYTAARKTARKNKEKFSEPKPKKSVIKVLAAGLNKELAEKRLEKLQEAQKKADARKAPKTPKKDERRTKGAKDKGDKPDDEDES